MAQRQDENLLILESTVKIHKRPIGDTLHKGFFLTVSDQPAITLKNIFNWYPFCERTIITGWAVQALNNKSLGSQLEVCLRNDAGDILATESITLGDKITPIYLPSKLLAGASNQTCHLTLRLQASAPKASKLKGENQSSKKNSAEKKSVRKKLSLSIFSLFSRKQTAHKIESASKPISAFISVHEVLARSEILQLCQGKGVEIGPGHNPQVQDSETVDVTYIEQSAPQDWERLYNDLGNYRVDPQLWSKYKIGDACNLPVEDGSLDFIFSSHVFEHLANPLGHLKYWSTKLKDDGKVLGIVPDVAGCKDYIYRPSGMSELLAEQASGDMEPTLRHYERWAKNHGGGKPAQMFYEAKRSIHVHYYTNRNMAKVLEYAVEHLGYTWFDIRHTPNHKDFYFLLSK